MKPEQKMKVESFDCSCHSDEHVITFRYFEDDIEGHKTKELYLSVFLNQYRNIFKRIWVAIKYIFGYKSKYGHWDCWSLSDEDCNRLKTLIEKFDKEAI